MDPLTPTQDPANMTPEEMGADLKQLMDALTQKYNTFHGQKKTMDTQISNSQNTAIASLFQILQKNGVDPSNQDEVNKFLQELQQSNPEGYQMFELAINNLLSEKKTLGQQTTPNGVAEPLNTTEQQSVEPTSPGGPTNDVSQIPGGPINSQAQPTPPAPTPTVIPPIPSGIPG